MEEGGNKVQGQISLLSGKRRLLLCTRLCAPSEGTEKARDARATPSQDLQFALGCALFSGSVYVCVCFFERAIVR